MTADDSHSENEDRYFEMKTKHSPYYIVSLAFDEQENSDLFTVFIN